MAKYLLQRLLLVLPSLLGISIVLFTVLALAPGDPFSDLANNPNVPPQIRMSLRAQFGLGDPIPERYLRWLSAMIHGDWGFSFVSRVIVSTLILQRLPATLLVLGLAQLLALLIALPVGVGAAIKPYSLFDQIAAPWPSLGFRSRPSSPACSLFWCSVSTWIGCLLSTVRIWMRPDGAGTGKSFSNP
jgi:peptide/nickel transport system permease protein